MKQIIFATNNPTKAKRFSKSLLEKEINVISLRDIGIKINIKEDGKDVVENALKKARECHDVTGKIAIGMDDSLYLENVPEDEQPGLFVRRVDGKVLEDDEKITLSKCNFSLKSLQSMIGCNCFVDINAGTLKLVVGDKVEIILI